MTNRRAVSQLGALIPVIAVAAGIALTPPTAVAAGESQTTIDVLKVVDGEYVVETVTVPTRDAAATEDKLEDGVGVIDASPSVTYKVEGSPDPFWDEQDPVGAAKVRDAWQRTQGAGQIVAVLDTGIDADHEDLAGALVPGKNIATGPGDPWHGTGVAGVVAARLDNGLGSAGIAPQSKVMPIRVCDDHGCSSANVARGILWAADHGADVINMSLSGAGYSDVTAAAIRYALDKNISVVASSGNDGLNGNPVMYPAANSGVIAVSSTQGNGTPSDWAVNGWQVDISTVGDSVLIPMTGNGYGNGSGTSFSGPAVAGAVALLRSSHPGITPEEVQAALQAGAESSNWNRRWGAGRLDIPAALAAADRTTAITATGSTGAVDVSWKAVEGANEYTVRIDGAVKATVTGTSARITGLTDGNQVAVDVQPSNGERSKPALVTIGAPAPSTPTVHSASLRGTSTSAALDLTASITGTPGVRYAIIRDGVSIGTVTYSFTSTPKTLSIGIGAMPTHETRWQLRALDSLGRSSAISNVAVAGAGKPAPPSAVTGLAATIDGNEVLLTWDDLNTTYSYQVVVAGDVVATSKTPGAVVPAPPANTKRTYQITAVDPYGQVGPAASTDVLIATKPTVTVEPAVLGDLVATRTVRTPDAFEGATSVVHNWKACSPGTEQCTDVPGGVAHYIAPSEVGKQLVVEAVATNAAGTTTVTSARSATITHPTEKPTSRVTLAVQGNARAGQTVQANSDFDGDYTVVHNWKACDLMTGECSRVGGGRTFFVTTAVAGKQLVVEARATNPAGTTIIESAKTPVVTSNVVKPVLLVAPEVQGTLRAGQTIRTPDTFHNATHGVVHNWKACDLMTGECSRIGGGTTFMLTTAHAGKQIVAEAIAKNGYGTTTVVSPKSGVVVSNVIKPVLLVAPEVQGTLEVGQTVSTPNAYHNATHGIWHTWKACAPDGGTCTTLGGGRTLYITSSLIGKELVVEAYAKNGYGTSMTASPRSAPVA